MEKINLQFLSIRLSSFAAFVVVIVKRVDFVEQQSFIIALRPTSRLYLYHRNSPFPLCKAEAWKTLTSYLSGPCTKSTPPVPGSDSGREPEFPPASPVRHMEPENRCPYLLCQIPNQSVGHKPHRARFTHSRSSSVNHKQLNAGRMSRRYHHPSPSPKTPKGTSGPVDTSNVCQNETR